MPHGDHAAKGHQRHAGIHDHIHGPVGCGFGFHHVVFPFFPFLMLPCHGDPSSQNRLLPAVLRDRALEATRRIVETMDWNRPDAADSE